MFCFEKIKRPKLTWAGVERISWARGSSNFGMFQFQTDFSSIMAHQVVHMDRKIKLKFLSAIQPFLSRK
jgi:hypothetical protein